MTTNTLIAIAELCRYSIAPAAFGDVWDQKPAWDNAKVQHSCQVAMIQCVREAKPNKEKEGDVLATCVLSITPK